MSQYEIGYYLIMSVGFLVLLLGVGFILKKIGFKKLMEEEDKEFEDDDE